MNAFFVVVVFYVCFNTKPTTKYKYSFVFFVYIWYMERISDTIETHKSSSIESSYFKCLPPKLAHLSICIPSIWTRSSLNHYFILFFLLLCLFIHNKFGQCVWMDRIYWMLAAQIKRRDVWQFWHLVFFLFCAYITFLSRQVLVWTLSNLIN